MPKKEALAKFLEYVHKFTQLPITHRQDSVLNLDLDEGLLQITFVHPEVGPDGQNLGNEFTVEHPLGPTLVVGYYYADATGNTVGNPLVDIKTRFPLAVDYESIIGDRQPKKLSYIVSGAELEVIDF